ncbi:MAG: S-layer homology domain-containing protein [Oscillospiraceae bacterium]|nr:S-layer homology domain-containing protein [Oscillospiraceae bacterium]
MEGSSYSVNVFYNLGRGEWRSNSAYHPSSVTVYSGKSTSFTPSIPIRSDCYFLGWTYDGQHTPVKTVTVPANYGDTLYLTANWEYEDYGDYDNGDYRVRVRSSSHGRVTANLDYAGYGDIVTLTVKPDSGYELQELTVTNNNRDREVSVTERGGASYRFTMPSSSVTVEAVFQQTAASFGTDTREAGTPDTSALPVIVPISPSTPAVSSTSAAAIYYADVQPRDWYYSSIQYISQRSLMKGTSTSVFSPSGTTTHAMIWTMLARLNGQNTGGGNSWYQSGLDWCRANGILDGIPNSSNPNRAVTREQLAVMLWHSKGSPVPIASLGQFTDSGRVSAYAQNALRWAVEQGIIKGSGGALNPQGLATRAETAQIFMNFISVTEA